MMNDTYGIRFLSGLSYWL